MTSKNKVMDEGLKEVAAEGGLNNAMEAADPPPGAGEIVAALVAERDQLVAEKTETHDRFLRAQAEFQNFRKRAERERAEFAEYASTEAVRALLPILDDFERALKVDSPDRVYAKGMELIHQRLVDSLKKLGLEAVESAGQPFDPNLHHAVDKIESADVERDTVLDEYQRGYNFKGRQLRPAMVKVAIVAAPKAENG